jgi:hypothetical protein
LNESTHPSAGWTHRRADVVFVLALAGLIASCSGPEGPPTEPVAPEPADTVQIAVLLVEEFPHRLESGAIFRSQPCGDCDTDAFPLSITYLSPSDSGAVVFVHAASGDTLFAATIWWSGRGEITKPALLIPGESFERGDVRYERPSGIEFFSQDGHRLESDEVPRPVDDAWGAIDDLVVVGNLLQGVSHVAAYRYVPDWPFPDYHRNRWVFFLYSRHPGKHSGS